MPTRGRKPTPRILKKIRGSQVRRDRPSSTIVPAPRQGAMVCPPAILKNPAAKKLWEHYLRTTAPGHLMPLDAPLLARLCMTGARIAAAEQAMGCRTIIKAVGNGAPIRSPLFGLIARSDDLFLRLHSALALPPAERGRLGIHDEPDDDDPAARYFK